MVELAGKIFDELKVHTTIEEEIFDLTREELQTLAKDQQIPGRSKMDHDELAATVSPS